MRIADCGLRKWGCQSAIRNQSAFRNPHSAMFTCAIVVALAQATLPPLPRLSLDTYPTAAREAISLAHRVATERSNGCRNSGRARPRAPRLGAMGERPSGVCARAGARAARHSSGPTWMRSCSSGSRGMAKPPRASARCWWSRPTTCRRASKLAESLLEADDLDGSQRLFEALVREPAAEPAAEFGLGRIAAARVLHDAAITHLQRAVALFPEWGAAYYALARSYRALGRQRRGAASTRAARSSTERAGPPWRTRSLPPSPRSEMMRGRASSGA